MIYQKYDRISRLVTDTRSKKFSLKKKTDLGMACHASPLSRSRGTGVQSRTRFPLFAYVLNYPQGKGVNGILIVTWSGLWYLYLFVTSRP